MFRVAITALVTVRRAYPWVPRHKSFVYTRFGNSGHVRPLYGEDRTPLSSLQLMRSDRWVLVTCQPNIKVPFDFI